MRRCSPVGDRRVLVAVHSNISVQFILHDEDGEGDALCICNFLYKREFIALGDRPLCKADRSGQLFIPHSHVEAVQRDIQDQYADWYPYDQHTYLPKSSVGTGTRSSTSRMIFSCSSK